MTRFARGGPANKKKPNEASSWQELKKASTSSSHQKQSCSSYRHGKISFSSGRTNSDSRTSNQSDVRSSNMSKSKFKKKMGKNKPIVTTTISKGIMDSHNSTTSSSNSELISGNQNSKSLIEELEEMDRQQMIAICKEEANLKTKAKRLGANHNVTDETSNLKMDKKDKRREERRLKRQKGKLDRMVSIWRISEFSEVV